MIVLGEIPRNDVATAVAYVEQELAAGREVQGAEALIMLQDDPSELLAALKKVRASRPPRTG